MCKKIISKIVNNITGDLQSYLPYMDTLLQRPVFDRLSVVSACSIIAAHSYFNIPTEQVKHNVKHLTLSSQDTLPKYSFLMQYKFLNYLLIWLF